MSTEKLSELSKPAIWQRTGKSDKTHWIIFVKSGDSAREVERG